MNKKEQLKKIAQYLLSLDEETRLTVLALMAGQQSNTLDGGCQGQLKPKPEDGDTPYGEWVCSGGRWVWVPEIG